MLTKSEKQIMELLWNSEEQLIAADVDGDGDVSLIDATYIQRYLAHIITEFPIEQN